MSGLRTTHAELIAAHPTGGIVPSDCGGGVSLIYEAPEEDLFGGPRLLVQVWACAACGTRVSVDATNRRVLNSYRWASSGDLVGELARSFDPNGGKP